MTSAAYERIGQTLGGRFTVIGVIGEGGMGAVFDVRHEFTKQRGALKLLHQKFAVVDEVVARFINEASAAGRIESRHIVKTFDAGRLAETNEPYIFMERLEGMSLSSLLGVRGRLRVEEVFDLAIQVADGLQAAHAVGIVHRDIKPDNLFVVSGDEPLVKILDFGISKFAADRGSTANVTREGATLGTPNYMPPEQLMGQRELDHRADIYALGVVIYESVTGRVPFEADVYHELCQMICDGRHPPLSQHVTDIPPEFEQLVSRAMAVDMSDRFATMAEFRAEMLALGTGRARSFAPTHLDAGSDVADPFATDASAFRPEGAFALGAALSGAVRADGGSRPILGQESDVPVLTDAESTQQLPVHSAPWLGWAALGIAVVGGAAWLFSSTVKETSDVATGAVATSTPSVAGARPSGLSTTGERVPPAMSPAAAVGVATTSATHDAGNEVVRPPAIVPVPPKAAAPPPLGPRRVKPPHAQSSATKDRRSIRDGLRDENPFE